ncbi:TetR family transcriptional regulator [Antricoccus suffuscus]|uniref:TetR family transcriptional regulator n=1 Tax=Antricoccus suffuscus TaxID=1629062 RepID=A0A2T1A6I3_9ACTN|nr:TetR/AcrR family transcriptional regulator [Antricoccus suffuscus]PRZ44209.1 TetR family transcriptional regulator [Antricoccus suffuscus]
MTARSRSIPTKRSSPGRHGDTTIAAGNKRAEIFDAAVALFLHRGYDATSMRDIAAAVGVMPASIYYHYESKEALLVAAVADGAGLLKASVDAATDSELDPWTQLERACAAHLTTLLHGPDVVRVLYFELQRRREGRVESDLLRIRREYENLFRDLIDALPIGDGVSRTHLRLTILGAMAWSPVWYRREGDSPTQIARALIALVRYGSG